MDGRQFAESLKEARAGAGLTMEQLADQLRVSRQAVGQWEDGSTSPQGPARIVLSQIFNVPLDLVDSWFAKPEVAA
jgi:transcriptional regulator with XRE-family HTH domain